jgi:polysaccharide deacetylase family protein (PEP-CTERM system associated)
MLLTFDIEDWFQVENLRPWFPPTVWDNQQLRVEKNTCKLLDLLDSITLPYNLAKPKGTFFILGWIAQRLSGLVREIQIRGHEVASHGYNHLMCTHLDPKDLKEDLIKSKGTIEGITGVEVRGYRAPNFSISDTALKLIQDSGYKYDSSYNNYSKHKRYGTITLNRYDKTRPIIKITKDFNELPISNLTIGNQNLPWGGGGYFRFLPLTIFKSGVKRILQKNEIYTFYLHPWEIDPDQPRLKAAKGIAIWKHYLNIDKTLHRLQNFIFSFNHCRFPTCSQYLDELTGHG